MALEYPYSSHPTPGTTVEVAQGVRWLTMPMGGSLTHINLYLLEDTDGWFVVDTGLADGDLLTIGDHDWQVVIGAGHSPEHACLHCHSLGVMISGDQILPVITSNVSVHPTEPEANPLKIWIESHDKFLDTPEPTFVLPAHNLPFYGVRERLRDLIGHHEDRMLAIEEFCADPKTAKDMLPVLFRRKLDARQTMMALGEAIAHCHLLMHRNRLKRTLDEDGRYRFLSTDPDLERRAHPGRHDAPDDQPIMV